MSQCGSFVRNWNVVVTCQYMKSGQSACTFCISQGSQWRQDLRYIAVIQKEDRADIDPAL
jgi:hypothetical protein